MNAELGRYTLSLPVDLMARIAALAEAEDRSRSAIVRRVLRTALAEAQQSTVEPDEVANAQ